MEAITVLKAIFANEICGSNDCRNCYKMFEVDTCPQDICTGDMKREFIEKVTPHLNEASLDLGTLEDVNVEEFLSLFRNV